jgi:hypothetical protein
VDAKYGPLPKALPPRSADPDAPSCGCPADNGLVRNAQATCTDPVVARLGWYFDGQERQS